MSISVSLFVDNEHMKCMSLTVEKKLKGLREQEIKLIHFLKNTANYM